MTLRPVLLPQPHHLHLTGERCTLPANGVTWQQPETLQATSVVLDLVAEALACTGVSLHRAGAPSVACRLLADAALTGRPEAYRLTVAPDGILLEGADPAGIQHAAVTLRQLARQSPDSATLPCLVIEDWPDLPRRGLMLDVSRDKVPTLATVLGLVDLMVELKLNELQLYTEHTFAYADHREVWRFASPLTADDIHALDGYCRARHIDLVPNQNVFGHLERWLELPAYAGLAEAPNGFRFPWGPCAHPFSLCPTDPRSETFVAERLAELLPHFTSPFVNVGCDETFDVGQGRSREEVARRGGRVYLDFLLTIHRLVAGHGRRMQFWGDIILHHPELIPEIPRDVVALVWGYEASHPFEQQCAAFAASGLDFHVCPGTSSWRSVAGRMDNALANLRSAATHGAAAGAKGLLITDWGDAGHWQPLPVSYLGYAQGAAVAWCAETHRESELCAALDLHVFEDAAGRMARVAYDLGNTYGQPGIPQLGNSTVIFNALQTAPSKPMPMLGNDPAPYRAAVTHVDALADSLRHVRLRRADAALVVEEFSHVAALLQWGLALCAARASADGSLPADWTPESQGLPARTALVATHRRVWLARNRPGGLAESAARLPQP